MDIIESVRLRTPAKSLSDVEIPDSSWKPDFDIVDRYQSFASELMRIALLGIAVYGFLLKEVYMREKNPLPMTEEIANCLWIGSVSLGISLAQVLTHRFYQRLACTIRF